MRLLTKEEASKFACPLGVSDKCICEQCMAFEEVHSEYSRENHSNGMQLIQEARSKRGYQELRRVGRMDSCDELLILDSLHTCRALYKDDGK